MPSPIFLLPSGPWGYNPTTGAPENQYFDSAPFFSFGSATSKGTVANSIQGAISQPFVPLIFDESPNQWADAQLCTADLVMGLSNTKDLFYYC